MVMRTCIWLCVPVYCYAYLYIFKRTCVRADVLLQVRQLGELAVANVTFVRLDARVDAVVLRQVRGVGKAFLALRTSEC